MAMYLIDFRVLVTQILPPTWRKTWVEKVAQALLAPLGSLYEGFVAKKKFLHEGINANAQVKALEYNLNKVADAYPNVIYIRDDSRAFSFTIFIPENLSEEKISRVRTFVKRYKLLGTSFSTQTY